MIVGDNGPAVVISAETAYWLEKICNVAGLRQRLRDGRHQEVSKELLELRRVAMGFNPSRLPSQSEVGSDLPEVDPELISGLLSPMKAADLLGMSDRAVRLACEEGRMDAQQVGPGRRWRITRQAVENFRASRAA